MVKITTPNTQYVLNPVERVTNSDNYHTFQHQTGIKKIVLCTCTKDT